MKRFCEGYCHVSDNIGICVCGSSNFEHTQFSMDSIIAMRKQEQAGDSMFFYRIRNSLYIWFSFVTFQLFNLQAIKRSAQVVQLTINMYGAIHHVCLSTIRVDNVITITSIYRLNL